MIRITRLNNSQLVVNANLIEFVEATPDTLITLTNDRHIVVQESVDDVVQRVVRFLRAINAPPISGSLDGDQQPVLPLLTADP